MAERKTTLGPGPHTKGVSPRDGPRRWTGGGPTPAKQIPWLEIFKNHISNIEGHLRMCEMVRKHTFEGSGNYRAIIGCLDRAREMLQDAEQVSRTFIPSPSLREQVPLGSSSVSMHPGYSPADHEYGKAAQDYDQVAAAEGIELEYPDAEYETRQARGSMGEIVRAMRESQGAKDKINGNGSGKSTGHKDEESVKLEHGEPATTNGQVRMEKDQEAFPEGESTSFVIDTHPTPVNVPERPLKPLKRNASHSEDVAKRKHKKVKSKHDGEIPEGEAAHEVKTKDITEQVDARMKEKDEKRKMKEIKKRKRDSEGGRVAAAGDQQPAIDPSAVAEEMERPKKKKKKVKSSKERALPDRTVSKKRAREDEPKVEDGAGKMKKKRKKNNKRTAADIGD